LDDKEPFFIYHVGSFHFEPLIRMSEHHQGVIYCNYLQVDFEDKKDSSGHQSIIFTLKPGSLSKKNFSTTQNNRLDSISFQTAKKIRVLYSDEKEFNREKENHYEFLSTGLAKKTNVDISILTLKTDKISVSGDEIIFNDRNNHTIVFC
jgi:hypothetical protein